MRADGVTNPSSTRSLRVGSFIRPKLDNQLSLLS